MSNRTIARRVERLEPRHLLSATVFEHDGIAYFLNQSDPGFARYDISAEQWLAPIDLAGANGLPTTAHADDDGFYVAYGNSVYRYGLDGSGQAPVMNTQYAVQRLHTDGDLLFINHSSGLYARVVSVAKSTNTVIDTADFYVHSIHGSSIDPGSNRIFGRSQGVSPSDISYVSYDDAGNFLTQVESPYHSDYPGGNQTWVFDDGTKVVDNSGTIYTTSLQYANSFGLSVTDIDFVGGQVPIVLSGSTLTAFSAGILPTGSATVAGSPSDLFVNDENAIVFRAVTGGWTETIVPLSTLSAPEPGEAIDPEGLPFTPDKIELAADGTVLLFSKQHSSVFRFDPITQTWGDTIPLIGSPLYMAYSAVNQKIYVAYDTGLIRQIDLASQTLEDTPFATLPSRPLGLATAGEFIFSADDSGAWESHYTFAPDGAQISAVDWNYGALQYTWSPANRKMYFFRDGTSPNDILWEEIGANGAIGTQLDSPLHSSAGFTYPIRVSPDGGVVILGSGVIHDAGSLARLPQALGNSVTDVAWLGSNTHTIRTIGGVAQLQTWAGTNWGQSDVAQLPGTAVSLTTVGDNRMLAITRGSNGVPQMMIVDGALNIVPRPIPVAIAGNDVRVDLGFSTTLNGSESFDPDNSPGGLSYSWRLVDGPGEGQFGDADAAITSFSAAVAGDYVMELTVSDGQYESTDTVIVTYRLNLPPVVDTTGSDTAGVAARGPVSLTSGQSTDPNGDSLTFQWELIAAPAGANWTLTASTGPNASLLTNTPGEYEVRVTASDGSLEASDVITVTFAANQAPTADASLSDLTGVAGRHAADLDARASTDPEGDSLIYRWEIISGPNLPAASITGATTARATFRSTVAGVYQVRLTVNDGLATDATVVDVTIAENQSPIADASRSVTEIIFGAGTVRLDGSASSDPDDTSLNYSWRVVASSNNSTPSISSSQSSVAFLNPMQPGLYAVELTVSDGASSDQDYVLITVVGNQVPQADASASDAVVVQGNYPRLDASNSFDPDGDELTYDWTVVASSAGTLPEIAEPSAAHTHLLVSDVGSYAVRLTVDDGTSTASDFVIVTVRERFHHAWTSDFDGNGWVDASDYIVWRKMQGTQVAAYTSADSTGDGWINSSDYAMWRSNFGSNPGADMAAAAGQAAGVGTASASPLQVSGPNSGQSPEAADSAITAIYADSELAHTADRQPNGFRPGLRTRMHHPAPTARHGELLLLTNERAIEKVLIDDRPHVVNLDAASERQRELEPIEGLEIAFGMI
ncbi:MAG TPA: hypothetical protein VGK58_08570 [Lacipirellulaceae bacterium]